jgi:hypothetical protein
MAGTVAFNGSISWLAALSTPQEANLLIMLIDQTAQESASSVICLITRWPLGKAVSLQRRNPIVVCKPGTTVARITESEA